MSLPGERLKAEEVGDKTHEADLDEHEPIPAFKAFDRDGNSSADEMLIARSWPGERLTAEEVGDMTREADLDGDRRLNVEELAAAAAVADQAMGEDGVSAAEALRAQAHGRLRHASQGGAARPGRGIGAQAGGRGCEPHRRGRAGSRNGEARFLAHGRHRPGP